MNKKQEIALEELENVIDKISEAFPSEERMVERLSEFADTLYNEYEDEESDA